MCGLFGAFASNNRFTCRDYTAFVQATDVVSYRGPDDRGCVTLNVDTLSDASGTFDVFLGHRRLAILDLSAGGHQPMTDGLGHWIVFNGEIFNFLELREELAAEGHQFYTQTDTEVILHVYQRHGEGGFEKLNGMWACALIDVPRRRALLSRDRFSIKPLYLLQRPNRLYFASEIKQLLPFLPSREVNTRVLNAFLAQGLIDHTQETFFKGIRRVPAKTTVEISLPELNMREHKYWDYSQTPAENCEHDAEQLRELLATSVQLRLRSDVKVGLLLSGGLDSSSLAVLVHQLCPGQLETYSLVSEDQHYSEERYVNDVCARFHLPNRKVTFQPEDIRDGLDDALYHNDEPFGSLSFIGQYKLFEKIKQESDTTVLLSGQGGDEVLLGYLKFFFMHAHNLLRSHCYVALARHLLASVLHGTAVRQFNLGQARRFVRRFNAFRHVLTANCDFEPIAAGSNVRERQESDLDKYSVPALTHAEDRNSMAHSLEVRHPFLDHRVVDFALTLPVERKLQSGWSKYVLRQGFPELPPTIRWRKRKQGFTTSEEAWVQRELASWIRGRFVNSGLQRLGLIDDQKFLTYYDSFRAGAQISFADISRTVIADAWATKYLM